MIISNSSSHRSVPLTLINKRWIKQLILAGKLNDDIISIFCWSKPKLMSFARDA